MPLYDRGLTVQEISEVVDRDRDTVRKAINYWFQAHGRKKVDGRARYQQLLREKQEEGGAGGPTA